MQKFKLLYPLAIASLWLVSCAGNPENNNAKSVNVDSTNINGTAPVQYGADNPADTVSKLSPADDTGRSANTSAKPE